MNNNYAPGARVEIRDEEWVIRRVDGVISGGYCLNCEGVSELVKDKDALFLTTLESNIKILDPKETELIQDNSPQFTKSLLYIESQLRQSIPNDEEIHVAKQAAMNVVEYQLEPALQALKQPRQRILIADAVGLGKTLEAGILVTELIERGRGKRILVLTLKSMMTQFQKEFWNRFSIPLTRLDSIGLQRVRNRIPINHNPFYYYDKSIISIDTLKQDNEFKGYLERSYWDIIIIDEAHNVADRSGGSQRSELAKLLARKSDTLILLSATPHDGRAESFASLLNMLDPTAIADTRHYTQSDFANKGLVIRRFKNDIKAQVTDEFKERIVTSLKSAATPEEEATYEALLAINFTEKGILKEGKSSELIRIGLQKALFSSPNACLKSTIQRIKTLLPSDVKESFKESLKRLPPIEALQFHQLVPLLQTDECHPDITQEIEQLFHLRDQLLKVTPDKWSKYQRLIELLQNKAFDWKKNDTEDRLVIFSERLETLDTLERLLIQDLKLKDQQITQLHGGMSDIEQQTIVEAFGQAESPIRILLCSDVASEGINLHYLSHRLIHFDLPWSLMVFQQRNGRVDRYGQSCVPEIYYLITESQNEIIKGDTRILEVLCEKDEQAYENIGDPATFMGVYNIQHEEAITEEAMANRMSATDFDEKYAPKENAGDALLELFNSYSASDDTEQIEATQQTEILNEIRLADQNTHDPYRFSLYTTEYDFAKAALRFLNQNQRVADVKFDDQSQQIVLVAPDDLKRKFAAYPSEIYPKNDEFILIQDKEAYLEIVKQSRQNEHAWPHKHYLWRRHPVVEWLQDRMLGNTGRHQALVMGDSSLLQSGEAIFLVSALLPNRKAHPVIWEWYAIYTRHGEVTHATSLAQFLSQYGSQLMQLPNDNRPVDMAQLNQVKSDVVDKALMLVLQEKEHFDARMMPQLEAQLNELDRLKSAQEERLEQDLEKTLASVQASKRHREQKRINQIFEEYRLWVQNTWQTEKQPYIQIIAVLASNQ